MPVEGRGPELKVMFTGVDAETEYVRENFKRRRDMRRESLD